MSETKPRFNPYKDNVSNIRFSLRLTEKLNDEIIEYSEKCGISRNNMILKCIEYAMNNKEEI